jgi:DNA polymerase-3 subunit gamma/tau
VKDSDIAAEGEVERLLALTKRYSREDLLRAFDLLTKAEADVKGAAQPRFHLEMALLRWIYLRKLVPIEDLIQAASSGPVSRPGVSTSSRPSAPAPLPPSAPRPASVVPPAPMRPALSGSAVAVPAAPPRSADAKPEGEPLGGNALKDALLSEIRKTNPVLYNTLIIQAKRFEVLSDRVVLAFDAAQKIGPTFDKYRPQLESMALKLAGRRMSVVSEAATATTTAPDAAAVTQASNEAGRKSAMKEQALADAGVQALLEVFPAEIRDVEEM